MNDKSLDLGKGPILPLLLKMSGPSIAAMLAMAVYNLIDAFWLARLSPDAIAALTICFPLQLIFGGIGVGTGIGAGSYASRMFGAGEISKARQTAGQVFFLSAAFGSLLIGLVLADPDSILKFFGATAKILPLSRQYLMTILPGVPFLFLIMIINNLLRAEGRPHHSMYAVFFIAAISGLLDPLLIFGLGPFPRLGIQGAAVAAVISQISGAFLSFYYLQQRSSKYKLQWCHLRPDARIISSIYSTGFPTIVINLVVSLVMLLHNAILAGYSNLAVATLGIVFRTNGVVMMTLYGFGHGLMPLVGYSEGAGLYSRLVAIVRVAVKISVGISLLSCLFVEAFAPVIATFFSADRELQALTVTALRIHFSLPGHSMFFMMFFLIISRACVPKIGAATLVGLISGLVCMMLGMTKLGPLIVANFVLPAIIVDIGGAVYPRMVTSWAACLLVGIVASASKNVSGIGIDFLMGMETEIILQHAIITTFSSVFFGVLGSLLALPVVRRLQANKLIPTLQ